MKGQHTTDTLIPWEDSQRLRHLRRSLGYTQLDLATRLGLSEETISAIERGTLRGRRAHVQAIIDTFLAKYSEN